MTSKNVRNTVTAAPICERSSTTNDEVTRQHLGDMDDCIQQENDEMKVQNKEMMPTLFW